MNLKKIVRYVIVLLGSCIVVDLLILYLVFKVFGYQEVDSKINTDVLKYVEVESFYTQEELYKSRLGITVSKGEYSNDYDVIIVKDKTELSNCIATVAFNSWAEMPTISGHYMGVSTEDFGYEYFETKVFMNLTNVFVHTNVDAGLEIVERDTKHLKCKFSASQFSIGSSERSQDYIFKLSADDMEKKDITLIIYQNGKSLYFAVLVAK